MDESLIPETLQNYRTSVSETMSKSQDSFEKQLVYVSSGGLLSSVFFIEKIIKDVHTAYSKWLLVSSWIFLGVTLLINLFSHFRSYRYQSKTIEEINDNNFDYRVIEKRNKKVELLNIWSLICLGLGVLLLLVFITLNL